MAIDKSDYPHIFATVFSKAAELLASAKHQDHALKQYLQSWAEIAEKAAEVDNFALQDVILLFMDASSAVFSDPQTLTQTHWQILQQWNQSFENYLAAPASQNCARALIDCLSDPVLAVELSDDDKKMLLDSFASASKHLVDSRLTAELDHKTIWQKITALFNNAVIDLQATFTAQSENDIPKYEANLEQYLQNWKGIAQLLELEYEENLVTLAELVLLFIEINHYTFNLDTKLNDKLQLLLKKWHNLFANYLKTQGNQNIAAALIKCLSNKLWPAPLSLEEEKHLLAGIGITDPPTANALTDKANIHILQPQKNKPVKSIGTAEKSASSATPLVNLQPSDTETSGLITALPVKARSVWLELGEPFVAAVLALKASYTESIDTPSYKGHLHQYLEYWRALLPIIETHSESAVLSALTDVVQLFIEMSESMFSQAERLSQTQTALLNKWHNLFGSYLKGHGNPQLLTALVKCLADKGWPDPITEADQKMLLTAFSGTQQTVAEEETVTSVSAVSIATEPEPAPTKIQTSSPVTLSSLSEQADLHLKALIDAEIANDATNFKNELQLHTETWQQIADLVATDDGKSALADVLLLYIELSGQLFAGSDKLTSDQLALLNKWQKAFNNHTENPSDNTAIYDLVACLTDPSWPSAITADDERMLLAAFSLQKPEPPLTPAPEQLETKATVIELKKNPLWEKISLFFNNAQAQLAELVKLESYKAGVCYGYLHQFSTQWAMIGEIISEEENEQLISLADVSFLLADNCAELMKHQTEIIDAHLQLLQHWHSVFADCLQDTTDTQLFSALVECLEKPSWLRPLTDEDREMLLEMLDDDAGHGLLFADAHDGEDLLAFNENMFAETEESESVPLFADEHTQTEHIPLFADEFHAEGEEIPLFAEEVPEFELEEPLFLTDEIAPEESSDEELSFLADETLETESEEIAAFLTEEVADEDQIIEARLAAAISQPSDSEEEESFAFLTEEALTGEIEEPLFLTEEIGPEEVSVSVEPARSNLEESLVEETETFNLLTEQTPEAEAPLFLAEEIGQEEVLVPVEPTLSNQEESFVEESEVFDLLTEEPLLLAEELSAEEDTPEEIELSLPDSEENLEPEFEVSEAIEDLDTIVEETPAYEIQELDALIDEAFEISVPETEPSVDFAELSSAQTVPETEAATALTAPIAEIVEAPAKERIRVNRELVGMVQDEFMVLIKELAPEMASAADPAAFKKVLNDHEFKFENLAKACNTIGLQGLGQVFAQLSINMRNRRESDRGFTDTECDLFKNAFPLIHAYLTAINNQDKCLDLVNHLQTPGWKHPLDAVKASALAELLAEPVIISDKKQLSDRKATAEAADVSLELPKDVNRELLDSLLNELPTLTGNFSAAIQQIISGHADTQKLLEAQRMAHTLKGSGNIVGITGIAVLTHHLEEILEYLTNQKKFPTKPLANVLLESADCLEMMSEVLLGGEHHAPEQALHVLQNVLDWSNQIAVNGLPADDNALDTATTLPAEHSTDTASVVQAKTSEAVAMTRVPSDLVDNLLRMTGEGSVLSEQFKERINHFALELKNLNELTWQMQTLVSELDQFVNIQGYSNKSSNVSSNNEFDALEMEEYNELHTAASRLAEVATDIREINMAMDEQLVDLKYLMMEEDAIQKENQEMVQSIRMVPASTIASRCQRIVRQACRATNKEVELEVLGGDLLIDSEILNDMVDPLMHLLRNSVDHGIESANVRKKNNKNPVGKISLEFSRKGNYAVIRCKDDGGGLASGTILQTAIKKGLVSATQNLTEAEIHKLILIPGFSTRTVATQLSGRGIGMDAIQTQISAIQGQMSLSSVRGHGLSIEITIPLTLSSMLSLLVKCGGQTMAISNRGLRKIYHADDCQLTKTDTDLFCTIEGEQYPAKYFSELVGISVSHSLEQKLSALRIEDEIGKTQIVFVDELLGYRDLLVKEMGSYIPHIQGVTGASILGNGAVAPVIDLVEMLHHAAKYNYLLTDAAKNLVDNISGLPVALVVDDSLSARRAVAMLLKDSGGIDVETAIDGLDAIKQIEKNQPDIIIVDLEMPRMNGIELAAHVRGREAMKNTPIIMITSRATEKHRKQAEAAGVTKFMTKPFSEDDLMNSIRSLIGY